MPIFSVAENLHDRTIRHAVLMDRFRRSEVRRIVRFLNRQVFPDVLRQTASITAKMEGPAMLGLGAAARRVRLEKLLGAK